jgi:hypothetical protein
MSRHFHDKFIDSLKREYRFLQYGFPDEYKPLLKRVSDVDIRGILRWIIQHPICLKELSPHHPLRIEAAKPGQSSDYPFPVTIHFVMDSKNNVQLIYDPNSKLARTGKSLRVKKDPEAKAGEKPAKQRGKGTQKTVRDTWTFDVETHSIKPSVGIVVTGMKALKSFRQGKSLYQADNPFILPMHYGAEYVGHGERDTGQPKAIAFAPRAQGDLFNVINGMSEIKPDLADILWISYACIKSIALFHAGARLHRDVKAENFLFLRNLYGIAVYLIDWDFGLKIEKAKSTKFEAGTPLYVAFDRPYFSKLLKLHNQVLREITWFQTKEAAKSYQSGNMSAEGCQSYEYYMKLRQSTKKDKSVDLSYQYMRWRTQPIVQALKQCKGSPFKYAIQIILNTREPIALNTFNHPKDDVWALCLMLDYLTCQFRAYKGYNSSKPAPHILEKVEDLIADNLEAQRKQRLSAQELCLALEKLVKQMMDAPMIGLNETQRQACIKKFLAQLDYHHVKMGVLPQPPSPTSLNDSFSEDYSLNSSSSSYQTTSSEESSDEEKSLDSPIKKRPDTESFKISTAALQHQDSGSLFASRFNQQKHSSKSETFQQNTGHSGHLV